MADAVKQTRSYDSPRRREQAQATRLAILDAAERLFLRDGYAPTTMAAVAREARVALKTLYVAFETKDGILRALWNLRLRSESEQLPITGHASYRAVLDEQDPAKQLRLNARNSRLGKERVGDLAEVIHTAAPLDSAIAALWDRINEEYKDNQRTIVESIKKKRALARGLDVDHATDILWVLNHPTTWSLLVRRSGWTPDDYERWTGDSACAQLLTRPPRQAR
ncbi:MAG TPA: TetR family transcriptional regulator [Gaiellaceae bacterium]|jgi:AcrR family transcriptional regulator|nr:TetR family transcriptional regulator [Gaiellaceae bacterium]